MSSWPMIPLDEVCEFFDRRGVTPKKLGSDFIDAGFRVLSAKNIKQRSVNLAWGHQRFVDKCTYQKWMSSPLLADDVLLTSEAPLGEPAYIREELEWCIGQRLFCLRSDKLRLYGRFLFHAFQSPVVREDLLSRATGATAQGIRQAELRKVKVPVPEVAEQKRIVSILDEAFSAIAKAKENAEKNLANARELFESYLNRVFTQQGPGWQEKPLGEVCQFQNGYAFKSKWYTDTGIRLLRNKNVTHGFIDWSDEVVHVPVELAKDYERFDLNERDVVLSLDRPIISTGLKAAILTKSDIPSLLLQRVLRITSNELLQEYIFHWLFSEHFSGEIDPGKSLGVPHISARDVGGISIAFPTKDEQFRIVSEVEALASAHKQLETIYTQKLANLDELKQSLLQKAFTGQLTSQSTLQEVTA